MIATLMTTTAALTVADSLTPRTSNAVTATVTSTAGKLKIAVTDEPSASATTVPGAALIAAGSEIPKSRKRLATLPDHPTATVAAPSAYSRIKSQPMIHAMNSPSVA
jgi:hypothetical protein